MSRLVVVSNRVADLEASSQSGGLAVALGDALKASGGIWFGWDGEVVDRRTKIEAAVNHHQNVTVITTPLRKTEYKNYYLGYSNKVLWPSFHYRLDLSAYESSFTDVYKAVNARMAEALCEFVTEDDIIWVHDYHLIPMAAEMRWRKDNLRIGFFLHIPFPSPDILMAVPDHDWLFRTFFAYDVIGFQTSWDVQNFQRYAIEHAGGHIEPDGRVRAFGRTVTVKRYPIGIDVDSIYQMSHTDEAEAAIKQLAQRTLNRMQIIGVDRLDYTKGLPDRMRAFRRLLELYPENLKRVTLMQVAPPTREEVEAYTDIRRELESLSGAINGQFADFDWTPVRYIHRNVPRDTLAALFRGSKAGLVTPLRDGMNLVAKEYIAAQDASDPGVLILSRFAGAAEDLEESLLVNPYDTDDVASAMQRALVMPLDERVERHAKLLERVRRHDVNHWRDHFLSDLTNAPPTREP